MNNFHPKDLLTYVPILAVLPLIIGIFFRLGYLLPFDLQFLISSFSYSELALSSYSSILFALVCLYGYSLMQFKILDGVTWKIILLTNFIFIVVHYLPIFNMNLIELVEKLVLLNTFIFFNIKKDIVIRSICIFMLIVVAPVINGFGKYYEFPLKASNKVILKDDSTEWYLVEKVSNTLVLVDKNTLKDKEYSFKFVELKDIESMESGLWASFK